MMQAVRKLPSVRKAFVASGVRHDLALLDERYVRELVRHHVGGHLKLAPEHVSAEVLELMHKPRFDAFVEFVDKFARESRAAGLEQYVVPYLISSHPGCTLEHMRELATWFNEKRWNVEQVQDFLPTPMTVSTAMYHAGVCPFTAKRVHVARTHGEKAKQRGMMPVRKREA